MPCFIFIDTNVGAPRILEHMGSMYVRASDINQIMQSHFVRRKVMVHNILEPVFTILLLGKNNWLSKA